MRFKFYFAAILTALFLVYNHFFDLYLETHPFMYVTREIVLAFLLALILISGVALIYKFIIPNKAKKERIREGWVMGDTRNKL